MLRDIEVSWSDAATGIATVTAPDEQAWTARFAFELRWPDGRIDTWSVEEETLGLTADYGFVPVSDRVGDALWVGYVTLSHPDGRTRPPVGLGGQRVSVGAGGVVRPSSARLTAQIGVDLFEDPHDAVEMDREVAR